MEKASEKATTMEQENKFRVDVLAAHAAKLFGVSSCTFAGATFGLTGEYTIEEMKSIIEEWKKKEVI